MLNGEALPRQRFLAHGAPREDEAARRAPRLRASLLNSDHQETQHSSPEATRFMEFTAAPIAVLTVGVIVLTIRRKRWQGSLIWIAGLVVTGSYWFIRNLKTVHNPLPYYDFHLRNALYDPAARTVALIDFDIPDHLREPATERELPPPLEAPPDMARLLPIAERNGMVILGPPGPPPGL